MIQVEFKDGVVIELHENGTFDVVELSRSDIEFNTIYGMGDEGRIFNAINNRLGGVLSA